MLGHHAEGRHVAQFPDIGRRQRQRNAHHIIGDGAAGVLGFRNLSVFRGLGLKIGAAVGLIVLEGEKDILCRHGLSIGPGHSVLNGVGPGGGVFRAVGCQQRMVFALGILIDQRQFGYAAGQHIEVVLAEYGGFDGGRRADGQRVDGRGGGRFGGFRSRSIGGRLCRWYLRRFCRSRAAGCHGKHHQHNQQQDGDFFHHCLLSFCFVLSNT